MSDKTKHDMQTDATDEAIRAELGALLDPLLAPILAQRDAALGMALRLRERLADADEAAEDFAKQEEEVRDVLDHVLATVAPGQEWGNLYNYSNLLLDFGAMAATAERGREAEAQHDAAIADAARLRKALDITANRLVALGREFFDNGQYQDTHAENERILSIAHAALKPDSEKTTTDKMWAGHETCKTCYVADGHDSNCPHWRPA